MKLRVLGFTIAEVALICIMSLCGTVAFTSSALCTSLLDNMTTSRFSAIVPFATSIVFGFLFVAGFLMVAVLKQDGGGFTWLVIMFSLPTILSFNTIDLPRLIGMDFVDAHLKTGLSYYEVFGLGTLIIICYLLIHFIGIQGRSRRDLMQQGADPSEAESVHNKGYLSFFVFVSISLLVAVAISASARGIEFLSLSWIRRVPSGPFCVGLGCISLISIFIYWLASRRKRLS